MVNLPLMDCSTENGATILELPDKLLVSGKRKRKLLLEIEKKESKKTKSFRKLLVSMSQNPPVPSEQVVPEQ